eukprot:m.391450 g.391450  ORF g.391450 m.391450 type:complete len:150 (-) comp16759_c7_seq7:191-640(-)
MCYWHFEINTSWIAFINDYQFPSRSARQERTDKSEPTRKRASVNSEDDWEHASDEDDPEDETRGPAPGIARTIEPAVRTKSPAKSTVRRYLDETIQTTMLKALMRVARDRPDEPLLFIGNYFIEAHEKHAFDLHANAADLHPDAAAPAD